MNGLNPIAQKYIDEIKQLSERIRPVVAVRCLTYNQATYICETLEGFLAQRTDFPFIVIVHDDASIDGTQEIIKEYVTKYPDIIKPILEEDNQYSKRDGSVSHIMGEAVKVTDANYIALCEGDDYWTDPLKLQKQVDFLDSHPDYGMCYTQALDFNQARNCFGKVWGGPNESFEELYVKNTIPTLTAVFRGDLYMKYQREINPRNRGWYMGDYPLWLYFAANSKIKFMDFVSGVYRRLNDSASHSRSLNKVLAFRKNFYGIGEDMANLLNQRVPEDVWREHQDAKYKEILHFCLILNDNTIPQEAQMFYSNYPVGIKERLILKFPAISKLILKVLFKRRGYNIEVKG